MKKKDNNIKKAIRLFKKRQFVQAKKVALNLLKKDDKNIELLNLLGNIYQEIGQLEDAKKAYQKAMDTDKTVYYLYSNLAMTYAKEFNYKKAIKLLMQAINIYDKDPVLFLNLGSAYQESNVFKEAEDAYLRSLQLKGASKTLYFNLAKLYIQMGRFLQAQKMFEEALRHDSNDPDILFEYSLLYLKFGQYKEGFNLYRNRYAEDKTDKQTYIISKKKLLQRGCYIRGKQLLITDEQGFGDIIQFARYLPLYEQMGVKVSMQVRPLLYDILKDNFPDIEFLKSKEIEIYRYHYHIPLLDSAYFFSTIYDNIPSQEGYLRVDQKKSKEIQKRYFDSEGTKKRVGIVWKTNSPKDESYKKRQERASRNVELKLFLKYLIQENIQLYSMQVAVTEEERELLKKHNILSLGDHLVSFYDNALIIDNLDMLIAIDTVSAIIAGSMGKKVKVLLSDNPDWRWGQDGKKTNWFKTIDIYRKKDSWEEVFKAISNEKDMIEPIDDIIRLSNKAEVYFKTKRYEDAKQICEKILSKDKENYKALHVLGLILYKYNLIQDSINLLSTASKINPGDKKLYEDLQQIVSELKLTPFEKEYLCFKPYEFNISKFSIKDKEYDLNENATKLLDQLKEEVEKIGYDTLLYDTIKLHISTVEKKFYKGLDKYLELTKESNLEVFLEKLKVIYSLSSALDGFKLSEHENDRIIQAFIDIFSKNYSQEVYKAFIYISYDFYLINRNPKYISLLKYFNIIFKNFLSIGSNTDTLLKIYEIITLINWGTGSKEKEIKTCDKKIIKPFSKYLTKYFKKNHIYPVDRPYKHKKQRVCFVAYHLVFGLYSVGKVLYSLLMNLSEESSDEYDIYCYVLYNFDVNAIQKLRKNGIIIKTFKQENYTLFQEATNIREEAIKDEIDIAIFDMPWSIQTYLIESRIAPKQIYWTHGWEKYSLKNIDEKICHYKSEDLEWKTFGVQLAKEFLIGNEEDKRKGELIKKEFLEKYGKEMVMLGTIGRLVKLDSDEYIQTIAQIMKQNPNTIYIACGEGNSESIKKKIKKYHINEERFIFTGEISPHVYGWVIDIWPDTFPLGQGLSKEEFLAKGGSAVFHRKREDMKKSEKQFFLAESDKEYIEITNKLINDKLFRKKVNEIEKYLWFEKDKENKSIFTEILK